MRVFKRSCLIPTIVIAFVFSFLTASSYGLIKVISYTDVEDRLTIDVEEERLSELLAELGKKSSVQFLLRGEIGEQQISLQFERLPLLEGIKKILQSFNYLIVYDPSGRLEKVVISGAGSSTSGRGGVTIQANSSSAGENQTANRSEFSDDKPVSKPIEPSADDPDASPLQWDEQEATEPMQWLIEGERASADLL